MKMIMDYGNGIALFYCPKCEKQIPKHKQNGLDAKTCSHNCFHGVDRIKKDRYGIVKGKPCDECNTITTLYRYKKKDVCGICLNGGTVPLDVEDYSYNDSMISRC